MTRPLRIVFAGTPEFSVPAFEALRAAGHAIVAAYTQPDRPAGRGREVAASPVKRRALAYGYPVEQPPTFKHPDSHSRLVEYAPDLMVVVAYGLLLPKAVLEIPRLGCLNIHASLLPRWRGAAPIQRAILAGDAVTGVTIMKMDAGLDTGPELLRIECPIGPRDTSAHLHERLAALGARGVVEAVAGWSSGSLHPTPQPPTGATYASKVLKSEARIDWNRSAEEIDRQVRAFNPRPMADTVLAGEQIRVWEAEPAEAAEAGPKATGFVPGRVLPATPGRLLVATGSGLLELKRLQLPGRNSLSAKDFLNSRSLAGARFGDAP